MYIVALGWLYVVVMMSITEPTFFAGLRTFLLYGLVPLALFLWLMGSGHRRRLRHAQQQKSKQTVTIDSTTANGRTESENK